MASIGALSVDLRLLSAKFEQGLDRSRKRLGQFSSSVDRSRKLLTGFTGVLGVAAFTKFVSNSLDAADAIGKAADAAGIGVERLQSLRFAAEQSGVSAGQLDDGMKRLNRRLGLFINDGGGPAAAAFRTLGLETDIASGKLQSTERVFDRSVTALQGIENQAQRTALASQLFGEDAGPKLALLLNKGESGIADLENQARSLGLVLDREVIRNAETANDKFNVLSRTIQVKLTGAIVDNADAIGTLADAFLNVISGASEMTREVARSGQQVAEFFALIRGDSDKLLDLETRLEDLNNMLGSSALNRTRFFSDKGGLVHTFSDEEIRAEIRRLEAQKREILKARNFAVPTGFAGLEGSLAVEIQKAEQRQQQYTQGVREAMVGTRDEIKSTGEFWKAINEITADGFKQMQDLAEEGRSIFEATRTPAEQLNAQISRLNELLEAGAINWDTYSRAVFDAQDKVDEQSKVFNDALKKQEDQARDLKSITEELNISFNSAFEDAIVNGKKFSTVLQDLAKDLLRLVVRKQVTEPIYGAINSAITGAFGGGTAGARAMGGPVTAGASYLVGEKGPEIFTPSTSGNIIPNGGGGGSAPVINQHFTLSAVGESRLMEVAARAAEQGAERGYAKVQEDLSRNGPIRRSLG